MSCLMQTRQQNRYCSSTGFTTLYGNGPMFCRNRRRMSCRAVAANGCFFQAGEWQCRITICAASHSWSLPKWWHGSWSHLPPKRAETEGLASLLVASVEVFAAFALVVSFDAMSTLTHCADVWSTMGWARYQSRKLDWYTTYTVMMMRLMLNADRWWHAMLCHDILWHRGPRSDCLSSMMIT